MEQVDNSGPTCLEGGKRHIHTEYRRTGVQLDLIQQWCYDCKRVISTTILEPETGQHRIVGAAEVGYLEEVEANGAQHGRWYADVFVVRQPVNMESASNVASLLATQIGYAGQAQQLVAFTKGFLTGLAGGEGPTTQAQRTARILERIDSGDMQLVQRDQGAPLQLTAGCPPHDYIRDGSGMYCRKCGAEREG